ncbi:MAG TPA: hypothetical protein DCM62_09095, partial [Bacteroidales bacterium]|nr:hypothetical protein [Bacteroidales bacterium]
KTLKIAENLEKILAIELLNAAQALSFRETKLLSPIITAVYEPFRKVVPCIDNDTELYILMENARLFVVENDPRSFAEKPV